MSVNDISPQASLTRLPKTTASQGQRVVLVDLARSAALVAMILYHSVYDMSLNGFLPFGTATTGFWWVFARLTAGTFLFLAGFSLYLAHGPRIRMRSYLRRLAVLVAAALGVSVATYLVLPASFVFFGILHIIAFASVAGLLFLRLPVWVTLAVAVVFAFGASHLSGTMFDAPLLKWVGLYTIGPRTMDFEPVFPWLAPFLFGLALGKMMMRHGPLKVASVPRKSILWALSWPGKHSLAIYLLHQPILLGLFMGLAQIIR